MRAVVVTCFESDEERTGFVKETFEKMNYEVSVISTNFSHIRKSYRDSIPEAYISIDTKSYKSNLSVDRLMSHYLFARDSFKVIEEINPDLIWIEVPANSFLYQAKKYKKKHPEVKIIADIVDMWPESLPLPVYKYLFPLNIWHNLRKNNLDCVDYLCVECDFYKDILLKEYKKEIRTIHWSRINNQTVIEKPVKKDVLSLCYVGSINNIIDISLISDIVRKSDLPVDFHIIGDGENKDLFIEEMKKVSNVVYHGVIRDEKKKTEIFNKCHAGINIYKKNLYIGLTTKCIDYFENGLPIINNIKGDTWKFVEEDKVGINIDDNGSFDAKYLIELRDEYKRIHQFYENHFTKETFIEKCSSIIEEVTK